MTFSSDAEIEHIAEGVLALTLPKVEWTHAAHFAAAVWLLAKPEINAFTQMPDFIKAYNEATGVANTDTDGYHETITQASLLAARHMIKSAKPDCPLFETVNTIMTSAYGRPDWLLTYWSKEALFSVKARRGWVAPDLKSLPFSRDIET